MYQVLVLLDSVALKWRLANIADHTRLDKCSARLRVETSPNVFVTLRSSECY